MINLSSSSKTSTLFSSVPGISAVIRSSFSVSLTSTFGAAGIWRRTGSRTGPKRLGKPKPPKASSKRRFISRRNVKKGSVSSPDRDMGILRENGNNDLLALKILLRGELSADGDLVIHSSDAWCRPGGSFRLLTFCPGAHRAFKDHLAVMGFDGDPVRIDFRAAADGFFAPALYLGGREASRYPDG